MDSWVSDKYETGEVCKECGKPLYKFLLYGKEMSIECECQTAKRKLQEEEKHKYEEQKKIEMNIKSSGVPPRLRECSFENFEVRKGSYNIVHRCMNFVKKFGSFDLSMLLIGPQGSGKTHLACAIGNELLKKGYTVKFARAADIPYEIQKTYDNPGLSESDIVEPLRRCSLLILDDIGADKMTDYDRGVIQSLVDYRINYKRPTVYTTNLTEEKMNEVLDTRTVDRIFGNSVVLVLNLTSYRRKDT